MKKWEYLRIKYDEFPTEKTLNIHGDAGWELVSLVEKYNVMAYFKREVKE